MTLRTDALFEAPAPHMATEYGTAYAEPEFEDEWEMSGDGEYGNYEFEDEWEMSGDGEYGNYEFEDEWEMDTSSAYNEFEEEWELGDGEYGSMEFEDEAEYEAKKKRRRFGSWLRGAFKKIGSVAKRVIKKVAPIAGKVAGSVFGGPLGGKIGGALGGGVAKALGEAEMEVAQLEAEFFGMGETDAEIGSTAAARDAALAEYLVAQAAEAASDSEAEAYAAAALPATIASMNAQQLRPYIPMLVQFYALLAKMLMQEGQVGRQLLRTLPYQQRRVVGALKSAARTGEPLSGKKAVGTAAAAAKKVMGSGKATKRAMMKNAAVQSRAARPTSAKSRRPKASRESEAYCPNCGN